MPGARAAPAMTASASTSNRFTARTTGAGKSS
jgi:hypothetical protein